MPSSRSKEKIGEMEPRGDGVIYWLLIKFLFFLTPLPWCNRNVKHCYAFVAIDMSVALVRRIELECAFLILYDSVRGDEAARARMLRLRSLPTSWVGFSDGEGREKPVNKKYSGEKRVTNVYRQSSQITSVFFCCSCVLNAHTCRTVHATTLAFSDETYLRAKSFGSAWLNLDTVCVGNILNFAQLEVIGDRLGGKSQPDRSDGWSNRQALPSLIFQNWIGYLEFWDWQFQFF